MSLLNEDDDIIAHVAQWEKASDYWKAVNELSVAFIETLPMKTLNDYYAYGVAAGVGITKYVIDELREGDVLHVLTHTHNRDIALHYEKKIDSPNALLALMEIATNMMIADCKSQIRNFFCNKEYCIKLEKNEN